MKNKFLKLFTLLLLVCLTVTNVQALEIAEAGETVIQEGNYDSLRLVAGNKVTNKATIDGPSLIAGNEVILEGSAPYGLFAGNSVTVNEHIEKDLFVAGNKIIIGENAVLGRDTYIAGNIIIIKSNITRDLRAGGSVIDLSNVTVGGDAYLASDEIIMNENTVITGKLIYPEDARITGLESATIGEVETKKYEEVVIEYNFGNAVYNFAVSAIAAIIVMLVLFIILPTSKERLDKVELKASNIAITALIGLAVLVVTPIVLLIAVFTGFLTPISLIIGLIYIVAIYLSFLLSSYVIGNVITTKLIKNESKYLALAIGIVLVKLVMLIPFIGFLISAICLFYGLGLVFNYIKPTSKEKSN